MKKPKQWFPKGLTTEEKTAKKTAKVFREGQHKRNKPTAPWGREKNADPNVQVSTPRSRRNRYQQSRRDRLKVALYTPDESTRGKARAALTYFPANFEAGTRSEMFIG